MMVYPVVAVSSMPFKVKLLLSQRRILLKICIQAEVRFFSYLSIKQKNNNLTSHEKKQKSTLSLVRKQKPDGIYYQSMCV